MDTWSPEQVVSLQQMGNSRARAVYEALLSDNFRRPTTDSSLESFIRAKYEAKKYIAREWIAPPHIKVDWDKEIDEEIENQKRKKKTTTAGTAIPEASKLAPSPINVAIPAPPHSPKTLTKKAVTSNTIDLLGLDTAASVNTNTTKPPALADGFDFFTNIATSPAKEQVMTAESKRACSTENSLAKEENDFFNQKTGENGSGEKGKLTKDSILALYGNASSYTPPQVQQFNGNFHQFSSAGQDPFFGQQPGAPLFKPVQQSQTQQFGNFNFGGTMQTQQINKLNEENIKKIESFSINFNNFK